jgi:recombination protein RecT
MTQENEKALTKQERFENFLPTLMPNIAKAWLKSVPLDQGRFAQITINLVQRNPKILQCEPLTLIGALMQCAEFSLYPDALRGHAWIIPRWDKNIGQFRANFQIGYKGHITLLRRTGLVKSKAVDAADVYERDEFYLERGLAPKLKHVPILIPAERGNIIGTYAIVNYLEADPDFDYVPIETLNEIRDVYSKTKDPSTPWYQSEISASWMRKKTGLIQVLKLSPALDDDTVSHAVALDEKLDAGKQQELDRLLDDSQRSMALKLVEAGRDQVAVVNTKTGEVVAEQKTAPAEGSALDAFMAERNKVHEESEPGPDSQPFQKPEPKVDDQVSAVKDVPLVPGGDSMKEEKANLRKYIENHGAKVLPMGTEIPKGVRDLRGMAKKVHAGLVELAKTEALPKPEDVKEPPPPAEPKKDEPPKEAKPPEKGPEPAGTASNEPPHPADDPNVEPPPQKGGNGQSESRGEKPTDQPTLKPDGGGDDDWADMMKG